MTPRCATATGISYRALQNYLSGDRQPGAEALARLVEQGIDVNVILTGKPVSVGWQDIVGLLYSDILRDKSFVEFAMDKAVAYVEKMQLIAHSSDGKYLPFASELMIFDKSLRYYMSMASMFNLALCENVKDDEERVNIVRNIINGMHDIALSTAASGDGFLDGNLEILRQAVERHYQGSDFDRFMAEHNTHSEPDTEEG